MNLTPERAGSGRSTLTAIPEAFSDAIAFSEQFHGGFLESDVDHSDTNGRSI